MLGLQRAAGNLALTRLIDDDYGQPLEPGVRTEMERLFSHDFGRVRVHHGNTAAEAASTLDAKAYTLGNDIVFGAGRYSPVTSDGKRLLAHELTHVVQQNQPDGQIASPHATEGEARQGGANAVAGQNVAVQHSAGAAVQCDPVDDDKLAHSTPPSYGHGRGPRPGASQEEVLEFLQSHDPHMPPSTKKEEEWYTPPPSTPSREELERRLEVVQEQDRRQKEADRAAAIRAHQSHIPKPKAEGGHFGDFPSMSRADAARYVQQMQEEAEKRKAREKQLIKLVDGTVIDLAAQPEKRETPPPGERLVPVKVVIGDKTITLGEANVSGERAARTRNVVTGLAYVNDSVAMNRMYWQRELDNYVAIRKISDLRAGVAPPQFSLLDAAEDATKSALSALEHDDLQGAEHELERAAKKLAFARSEWQRYRIANIEGAEKVQSDLENVRDASFTALAILAPGAGTAGTVLAFGAPLAGQALDLAGRAASGEKIEWGHVAADVAVQVALAKFGGKATESIWEAAAANPAVRRLGKVYVQRLIQAEVLHAGAQALTATAEAGVDKLQGQDVSLEQIGDAIIKRLSDPNGWIVAGVTSFATSAVEARTSRPAKVAPARAGGPKRGAKPKAPLKAEDLPKPSVPPSQPANENARPPDEPASNLVRLEDVRQQARPQAFQTAVGHDTSGRASDRAVATAGGPRRQKSASKPPSRRASVNVPPPGAAVSRGGVAAARPARKSFRTEMNDALNNASDPAHPLNRLVEPAKPGSRRSTQFRKVTRITTTGKTQTGRYHGGDTGPVVQAGHRDAFASGAPQEFMLEDADLNQTSGNVIESKGAFSYKERLLVTKPDGTGGIWVEAESLKQWERLGEVPPGTVAAAIARTAALKGGTP
jgi:hypothetical protein